MCLSVCVCLSVCLSVAVCLCLCYRQIHGNLGSVVAEGSETIEPEEWHHLVLRFDAQSKTQLAFNFTSHNKMKQTNKRTKCVVFSLHK